MSYFTPDRTAREAASTSRSTAARHWTRLSGGGWPTGELGRIGLAAAHVGTGDARRTRSSMPDKPAACIAPTTAARTGSASTTTASWSTATSARLTVDPGDPDTVFAMGRSIHRSTDGGKTLRHHQGLAGRRRLPRPVDQSAHPRRMITGPTRARWSRVNGGASWSSWYNQPTGQLYHLADRQPLPVLDLRRPAGQRHGRASPAAPTTAQLTFARLASGRRRRARLRHPRSARSRHRLRLRASADACRAGTRATGEVQNISPWPVSSYGARPATAKYRYTWITPIAISPLAPYRALPGRAGAVPLARPWRDAGRRSAPMSRRRDAARTGLRAATAPRRRARLRLWRDLQHRACRRATTTRSGLAPTTAGSSVTRDGGTQWQDVTPPDVPDWSEDQHRRRLAARCRAPRTPPSTTTAPTTSARWHGARTTTARPGRRSTAGLPDGHFVAVVRADTTSRGLLYAGTDRGVWVSFDDGDALAVACSSTCPAPIVNDLLVHGDDLIVATQGRSIWLIDDSRRCASSTRAIVARARAPVPARRRRCACAATRTATRRCRSTSRRAQSAGRRGDRLLAGERHEGTWSLAHPGCVRRAGAAVLQRRRRRRSCRPSVTSRSAGSGCRRGCRRRPARIASPGTCAGRGRRPMPTPLASPRSMVTQHVAAQGMLVAPGRYTLVLTANGHEERSTLDVVADPRVPVDAAALTQALALSNDITAAMERELPPMARSRRCRATPGLGQQSDCQPALASGAP